MEKNTPTVNISLATLIRECRKSDRSENDLYWDFALTNRENIHEVFKYRKFNYDFVDTLTCYHDGKSVVGYIRPSYEDFLRNVLHFLNVPEQKIVDDDALTATMMKQVERLSQVTSERELEIEFPCLYDDLVRGRRYIREAEQMPQDTEEEKQEKQDRVHYYYSCALKRSIKNFVETQVELYRRFTQDRGKYKELIESKNFHSIIRQHLDMNKVVLYVVSRYLKAYEETGNEEYLQLIDQYSNSNYDKNVVLYTDDNERVDWKHIKFKVDEIRKQKKKDDPIRTEWELIPEGRDYKKVKAKRQPKSLMMSEEEIKKLEALYAAGRRKQEFYGKSGYMARVIGLLKYRGYIAYIYPNGEVLLDKKYQEDTPSSAKGNAIYHMKVSDFEKLSGLDKQKLQKDKRVGRIIHSTYWEQKAEEVIHKQGTEKDLEEAKQLIKRLKEKNQ